MEIHRVLICANDIHHNHLYFGDDQYSISGWLTGIDVPIGYVDGATPFAFDSFVTTDVFLDNILFNRLKC